MNAATAVAEQHGVDFGVDDPFLQEHMTGYVGERITQLSRTTKQQVTAVLQRALASGENLSVVAELRDTILDAVRTKYEDFVAHRALRIARSESAIAFNHATVLGAAQAGLREGPGGRRAGRVPGLSGS